MGLRKGQTNNPLGRPKGKQNKVTEKVRSVFASLLEYNLDRIQGDLDSLSPKDRLTVILNLSEFVVPKLSREENLNLNKDLDNKPQIAIYLPDNGRD